MNTRIGSRSSRFVPLALAAAVFVAMMASSHPASAQSVAPSASYDTRPLPTYRTSIALHITAVVAAVTGTGMAVGGGLALTACAIGGSGCDPWMGIMITGGVLFVASIAIGIAATVVHGDTRAQREQILRAPPVVGWLSPDGGGLVLRLEL